LHADGDKRSSLPFEQHLFSRPSLPNAWLMPRTAIGPHVLGARSVPKLTSSWYRRSSIDRAMAGQRRWRRRRPRRP
jgi:hypothetical protein